MPTGDNLTTQLIIKDKAQLRTLKMSLKALGKHGTGARQHLADWRMVVQRGLIYLAVVAGCLVFGFLFLQPVGTAVFGLVMAGLGLFDVWRVKQAADLAICVAVDEHGLEVLVGGQEHLADSWKQLQLLSIEWIVAQRVPVVDSMTFQDSQGRQFRLVFSTLPRGTSLLAECLHQMLTHGELVAPGLPGNFSRESQ
jgi:hypothetical protein